jgi:hypothetical protein
MILFIKLIVTLSQFNLTSVNILDRQMYVTSSLHERDIIESAHNGVESAANGIATVIPGAASQVQSAVNAAATGALDAAAIPRNCSIGTTQFCVGFVHNIWCKNLPLNLSSIIPADVDKFFQAKLDDIQPLNRALAKVTIANIQVCLIAGLILILILTAMSAASMFGWFYCLTAVLLPFKALRIGIHLLFGLLCCIPFFVPAIVLYILKSKTQQLPPWIQVEQGEVDKLCLGGLCCAIVMVLLSSTLSVIF